MKPVAHKSDLSQAQLRLVKEMHYINFGRIENLTVKNGQPVFCPEPSVFLDFKFDKENEPWPKPWDRSFAFKPKVRRFIARLQILSNGIIQWIEIHEGLPFRMRFKKEDHAV